MAGYVFNNKGINLFDLLFFALHIPSEKREWFIKNLGQNIHNEARDYTINALSHKPDISSVRLLNKVLSGENHKNEYGHKFGDTAAVEDLRNILKILVNKNDINGQKVLVELLKEWEKIPESRRIPERFVKGCELLLNIVNSPDIKKYLMLKIADNAEPYNRFEWYKKLLNAKDLDFEASEIKDLYAKMLETKEDFIYAYSMRMPEHTLREKVDEELKKIESLLKGTKNSKVVYNSNLGFRKSRDM